MAPPGWSPRPGSPGRSTSSATASLCPSSQELHPLTAHTHTQARCGWPTPSSRGQAQEAPLSRGRAGEPEPAPGTSGGGRPPSRRRDQLSLPRTRSAASPVTRLAHTCRRSRTGDLHPGFPGPGGPLPPRQPAAPAVVPLTPGAQDRLLHGSSWRLQPAGGGRAGEGRRPGAAPAAGIGCGAGRGGPGGGEFLFHFGREKAPCRRGRRDGKGA